MFRRIVPLAMSKRLISSRQLTNLSAALTPVKSIFNPVLFNNNSFVTSYRSYSVISEECRAKMYDYNQIKHLIDSPKSESIIVDVREPVEYQEGHIPGAINIPFKSSPGALGLNEEDFEENFGFSKPQQDKELIFYCLAGIRSTAAEDLAKTFGYKKRGNYIGSYEDWVSNELKK